MVFLTCTIVLNTIIPLLNDQGFLQPLTFCNFMINHFSTAMRYLIILSILCVMSQISAQTLPPPKVEVKNGMLEGLHNDSLNVNVFLGVPFAEPPVGDLRWKKPQPHASWEGIRPAKEFGPIPMQTNVFGDMIYRTEDVSEDCLYLNVWTPKQRKEPLPVLVYFYGGGFVAGSGSEPRYDGASMASKGIVTVTINYRLNIFGFFAHPELSEEASYNASGNYGLLDQHAALVWVRENIAAFGGDPEKITIAGESAGSISVSAQMASPLSRELIAGAIGESGASINPTLAPVSLEDAEKLGVKFMKDAGYSSINELRALSAEELFDAYIASQRFGFPTVVDGYFLPATLPEIFEAGKQAMVPLLVGWNSAEIPGMAFMQGEPYTSENFIKRIKERFASDHQTVLDLYPHATPQEVEQSATDLASDQFISYSTWKWFDLHRKNSNQPVYRYLFSRIRPVPEGSPAPFGAPHASEIEYAMGNLPLVEVFNWTEKDYQTSQYMQEYFANFIRSGNPNGPGLPEWPTGSGKEPSIMVLDVTPKKTSATNDARYEFLDTHFRNAKE
jgi:para-nitrobenzyl esterase